MLLLMVESSLVGVAGVGRGVVVVSGVSGVCGGVSGCMAGAAHVSDESAGGGVVGAGVAGELLGAGVTGGLLGVVSALPP